MGVDRQHRIGHRLDDGVARDRDEVQQPIAEERQPGQRAAHCKCGWRGVDRRQPFGAGQVRDVGNCGEQGQRCHGGDLCPVHPLRLGQVPEQHGRAGEQKAVGVEHVYPEPGAALDHRDKHGSGVPQLELPPEEKVPLVRPGEQRRENGDDQQGGQPAPPSPVPAIRVALGKHEEADRQERGRDVEQPGRRHHEIAISPADADQIEQAPQRDGPQQTQEPLRPGGPAPLDPVREGKQGDAQPQQSGQLVHAEAPGRRRGHGGILTEPGRFSLRIPPPPHHGVLPKANELSFSAAEMSSCVMDAEPGATSFGAPLPGGRRLGRARSGSGRAR